MTEPTLTEPTRPETRGAAPTSLPDSIRNERAGTGRATQDASAPVPDTLPGAPARRSTTPDLDTIISTAARLFHERGYQNTTMQALAEALGIAKPTLYTHARSKLEILERIFGRALSEAQAVVDAAAALDDPVESLRLVITEQTRLAVRYRAYYGVFHGDQRELPAPLSRKYRQWSRTYVQAVCDIVARGQDAGRFRKDIDPMATAYGIIGMANWSAHWLKPKGRLSGRTVGQQYGTLLLEGLTVPD